MEKRLLLALVLSIGVVLIFSQFNQPPPQPQQPSSGGSDTATIQSASNGGSTGPVTPDRTTETAQAEPTPSPGDDTETAPRLKIESGTVPFQTAELSGSFNRRGATFRSVKLLDYKQLDEPGKYVDLVDTNGQGFTFDNRYPKLNFARARYDVVKTSDTQTYKFINSSDSLQVTKKYRFQSKPYRVSLTVSLTNTGGSSQRLDEMDFPVGQSGQAGMALRWGPGFGIHRSSSSGLNKTYVYYGKNGEMQYLSPGGGGMLSWFTGGGNESPYKFKRGPIEWTSISSRYFAATIIPENSFDMLFMNTEKSDFTAWSGRSAFTLGAGETRVFEYDLYLGPKEYTVLQKVYPGLEATLNYGWFSFLARPLLWGLNWIYAIIPNYGFAIIILSILIKMALYPLTKKGLTSMQKMKQLQPELEELQEKYSDDKEKLNQKMMEFYQENDLNPLGGCLPMLLQLPIFIGLYRMLEYSIELRGAPFMLWITDLSSKDPYYILPVVMGIVMFFQQRYTMTASAMGGTAGQQQKLMMYFMPVMFVFLFMNFPVGLVLYWMTNSLMTLVQYALINRSLENSS